MSSDISDNGAPDPHTYLALARRIRQSALDTEGVAAISKGGPTEVATRWVGEKVVGVRVSKARVEVHVVARYPSGFPIAALAQRLRDNLEPLLGGRRLDVVVDDLAMAQDDATL